MHHKKVKQLTNKKNRNSFPPPVSYTPISNNSTLKSKSSNVLVKSENKVNPSDEKEMLSIIPNVAKINVSNSFNNSPSKHRSRKKAQRSRQAPSKKNHNHQEPPSLKNNNKNKEIIIIDPDESSSDFDDAIIEDYKMNTKNMDSKEDVEDIEYLYTIKNSLNASAFLDENSTETDSDEKVVVDLSSTDEDSGNSSDVIIDEILSSSAPDKMIISHYSTKDVFEELDSDEDSSSIEDVVIKKIASELTTLGSHQRQRLQKKGKGSVGQPSPKNYKEKKNKKNKNKPRSQSSPAGSKNLVRKARQAMEAYINDDLMLNLPLAPMGKYEEMAVLKLAKLYNLKCRKLGSGKRKYTILEKTANTSIPPRNDVDVFIASMIRSIFGEIKQTNPKTQKEKTSVRRGKQPNVVAQNAAPIDEENVGNRLLRMMGWDGGGLGADGSGIATPIKVEIKQDRKGLGY